MNKCFAFIFTILMIPAAAAAQKLPEIATPHHYILMLAPDLNSETFTGDDVRANIGLGGQNIREAGLEKHVVKRKGFAYSLKCLHHRHYQLHSAARSPRLRQDEQIIQRRSRHRRRIKAHR